MKINTPLIYILIFLLGSLLFIPGLGNVHLFDWDEINFAESAREMLLTQDFFRVKINFQPFWEKPPLFIWFQTISMSIFGVSDFSARLPNAIIGIATLMVLFSIGKKFYDKNFGLIWVMTYIGSFLPHLYFKSGIIDPIFNLFIFIGIYYISEITSSANKEAPGRLINAIVAGLFIGLAVLTKGPVAFLIVLLSVFIYFIFARSIKVFSFKEISYFLLSVALIAFFWFGLETIKNGPWFLQEFIVYQIRLLKTEDAGHGGPIVYHWIVLLLGCFPASVFIFRSFLNLYPDTPKASNFKLWMKISFFVVLILFSIVKTKIVHYSSFCYFPLTFLASYTIYQIKKHKFYFSAYFNTLITIMGLVIGIILTIVPLFLHHKNNLIEKYGHLVKDPFALANLNAELRTSGWEFMIGLSYIFIILIIKFYLNRKKPFTGIIALFISTLLVIQLTLYSIVPEIEKISQGAAIEFYESLQGKDAYVDVLGYKSYAHLFYSRKPEWTNKDSYNKDWLISGNIDKPVYFVTKINKLEEYKNLAGIKVLGEKNGFVFLKREPTK